MPGAGCSCSCSCRTSTSTGHPSIVEFTSPTLPTSGCASHQPHTFSSLFQARQLAGCPVLQLSGSSASQPFSHQPHAGADTSEAGHYCDPPSPDPA
ncbi:hypothetical protein VDGL01_05770 [Verticillium dahliae]